MSKQTENGVVTPAYGSFKTFTSFIDDVRERGHIPLRIDRSEMPKLSGSAANETIATLKFFGLLDEKAEPTPLFEEYVMAADQKRKEVLARMVKKSYAFICDAEGFDIERATSAQVHELFRSRNISGSTLVRAVGLFLAATKDAGVKVSPSIKPPKTASTGTRPKKDKKTDVGVGDDGDEEDGKNVLPPGVLRFELPIPGKPSVQVLVPESLDGDDWDMLSQMFSIYVNRWKGYKPTGKTSKEETKAAQ